MLLDTKLLAGGLLATTLLWGGGALAQEAGTADQQARGANTFTAQCSKCHGANLQGVEAPALVGPDVMQQWGTAGAIFDYFSHAMPPNAPGSLPQSDYVDILAHILAVNGFAAGTTELTADMAQLNAISLAGATTPTQQAAPAAPATPAAPAETVDLTTLTSSDVPQAFTFGKTLPSVDTAAPAAPAQTTAPATPAVPQAFTFGKDLPATEPKPQ